MSKNYWFHSFKRTAWQEFPEQEVHEGDVLVAGFPNSRWITVQRIHHVPLKAQQVKGLWEYAPAVLTKGCYGGIGVEAMSRAYRSSRSQPQLAPPF